MRSLALTLGSLALTLAPAAAEPQSEPAPRGVWPLDPEPQIIERFDPPDRPWLAGHRGVDLLGRVGQPVRAALPGTISFSGEVAGRAVVVVDHGPRRTTYQPVAGSVPVGTGVSAGATIGHLSLRGSHCLPRACLHWGLIEGADTYLDPLSLVGCGPRPVRLYPLLGTPPPPTPCGESIDPRPQSPSLLEFGLRLGLTLVGGPVGRPIGADLG